MVPDHTRDPKSHPVKDNILLIYETIRAWYDLYIFIYNMFCELKFVASSIVNIQQKMLHTLNSNRECIYIYIYIWGFTHFSMNSTSRCRCHAGTDILRLRGHTLKISQVVRTVRHLISCWALTILLEM